MVPVSQRFDLAFEEALLSINRVEARSLMEMALRQFEPLQVVEEMVVPAMERVGIKWQEGTAALSQVYMSARLCEELVEHYLPPREDCGPATVGIAVLEDYHVLGKRVVYSALRAGGIDVIDYGHGLSVEELAGKVRKDGLRMILVSTLMLPSALRVAALREAMDDLLPRPYLVVGGAPFLFDAQLWREVGADAMGANAAQATQIVRRFLEGE